MTFKTILFADLLKRTLRRYKVAAVVAAAFFGVIAVALTLSLTFWRQAAHERDEAETARGLAAVRADEITAEKAKNPLSICSI